MDLDREIPFTQYLRPDGRKRPASIEMPQEIADLAFKFIEAGGWFEVEELTTGHASLTACHIVDDEPQDIAIRVVENGPPVVPAVEALVREAARLMAVTPDHPRNRRNGHPEIFCGRTMTSYKR